ncbi:energy-coupling factor transporter ATPase [Guggenheimella bovis]
MSIEIKGLNSYYNRGAAYEVQALKNINLSIKDGEFVALIGHTGSGKSTLIQHINGLQKPDSGELNVEGFHIDSKSKNLKDLRKVVGLVFQYPEYQLFEETVFKDIAFGPKNLGIKEPELTERIKRAMESVDLDFETYSERSPFDLSGGEKRRVALAGVLAMEPKVLMLDEPTAGLDPHSREELLDELQRLRKERNLTLLLVSHSMDEVAKVAERIIAMRKGEIVLDKPTKEAFEEADFLESIDLGIPGLSKLTQKLRACGFPFTSNEFDPVIIADTIEEALK